MTTATTFRIVPRGPFALAQSAAFLCGFTPADGASLQTPDGRLVLGFLDDQRHEPVVVAITQDTDGAVSVDGPAHVEPQVARLLSLDHDARELAGVSERDAIAGALVDANPGFRPVCSPSPYEAAVWAVLAQRIPMPVAARLKRRLAEATGSVVSGFGHTFFPTPAPRALLDLDSVDGLPDEKLSRLHGLAAAALERRLDASRLRAMPYDTAHATLLGLRGVGAWSAEHILVRGTGLTDALPTSEERVLRGIAHAYGLDATPSAEEARAIAEAWAPFRTWIAVLMVMNLRATGSWNARGPHGRTRRASAGRRAAPSPASAAP